jgi:hypothetical protein
VEGRERERDCLTREEKEVREALRELERLRY